jgi:hypothetical protein
MEALFVDVGPLSSFNRIFQFDTTEALDLMMSQFIYDYAKEPAVRIHKRWRCAAPAWPLRCSTERLDPSAAWAIAPICGCLSEIRRFLGSSYRPSQRVKLSALTFSLLYQTMDVLRYLTVSSARVVFRHLCRTFRLPSSRGEHLSGSFSGLCQH